MNQYFTEGETFLWKKDKDYHTSSLSLSLKMIKESYRLANKQGMIAEDIYTGKQYFLKIIFCEEMDSVYVEKESKVQLYSPFIVRIYGGMLDGDHRRFITVMEYIPQNDLSDLMHQDGILGENWQQKMMVRHKIALKFLHGIDYYMSIYETDPIVHRDLKPENLMVSSDGSLVKIVDFDWVHLHDSSHTITTHREQKGTPGYADPAYWNRYICKKSMDIYSAGLVLFFLYTGHHHFYGNEEIQRYMMDREYAYELKDMPGVEEEIRHIIAKMIAPEEERYTDVKEIIRDMEDHFKRQGIKIDLPEILEEEEEQDLIRFSYEIGDVTYRPYVKPCRFLPIEFGTRQERSQNGRMSGHIMSFYRIEDQMKAIILHEDCHPVIVQNPEYVSEGDLYSYGGTQIKILKIGRRSGHEHMESGDSGRITRNINI